MGEQTATIGPECRYGKHDACIGDAWCFDTDQPADCACECHRKVTP